MDCWGQVRERARKGKERRIIKMYLDYAIKLNDFISNLQEPQRFLMYMLLYIVLPLLLILLGSIEKNRKIL